MVLKPMFEEWAVKLLMRNYWSMPQVPQPHIFTHRDMNNLKDLTPILRAFTFEGKEGAYYIKNGKKIYPKL
jgi:hypothetical protein